MMWLLLLVCFAKNVWDELPFTEEEGSPLGRTCW